MNSPHHGIDPSKIEEAISMLQLYIGSEELAPLFAVLRELPENPGDEALLARLSEAVDNLGVMQGAVLTYAPVVAGLLSDDRFDDSNLRMLSGNAPRASPRKQETEDAG
jgi:hypothetical protein